MAYISFKKDIEKIHSKIDKIAKVGYDNFQEYYNYIDDMIFNSRYDIFTQVLLIKYNFNCLKYNNIVDIKHKSWNVVLSKTNSNFQDDKYKLLKNNNLYQIGVDIFRESVIPSISIHDSNGIGGNILPIISDGQIVNVDIINRGYNYTTSSYCVINGGSPSGEVDLIIKGGKIYNAIVINSGDNHGIDIRLGSIKEEYYYDDIAYTDRKYQEKISNKIVQLVVEKTGTMSIKLTDWDMSKNFDYNLYNLYNNAIQYLI